MATERWSVVLSYLRQVGTSADDGDSRLLDRFTRHGDQEAFATLLRRHGPLVWGVCRRILNDRHDAEDAFQATFLLLLRKASWLRRPESLGPWLYGVARRTALKARSLVSRRRSRETSVIDVAGPESVNAADWADLRPLIDDAIAELPPKYQAPVVLCYLQGLTNAEAARQLGCPPGTVATRLSRARERLRRRLVRRGVVLTGSLLTLVLAEVSAEGVPPGVIASAAGALFGSPPIPVVVLTKGVGNAMLLEKMKVVTAGLLAVGVVSLAAGLATYQALAGNPPRPAVAIPVPSVAPPAPTPVAPITSTPVPPPVAVAPPAQSERVAVRTDNFVVEAANGRIAKLVAEAAERHRKEKAKLWLGKELPNWDKPCPVEVKISLTGSGGASTFVFADGKVKSQSMTVEGALERVLANNVPHEVTHCVLADYFGEAVPRWADEGAAVLSEDAEEQERHDQLLRQILSSPGRVIPLRRLFPMKEYPTDVMALYVEGQSVARFLIEKKDRPTFLQFVKDGMKDGWDKAVKAHYDFKDVESLEDSWMKQVGKDVEKAEAKLPEGLNSSPAPLTSLARIDRDGRLVLRYPLHYVEPRTVARTPSGANAPPPVIYAHTVRMQERVVDLDEVQAFDRAGQEIDGATLRKRLKGDDEVPVLLSLDDKKVEAYHLQLVRDDAVILVVPQPRVVPAVPSVTVPARP